MTSHFTYVRQWYVILDLKVGDLVGYAPAFTLKATNVIPHLPVLSVVEVIRDPVFFLLGIHDSIYKLVHKYHVSAKGYRRYGLPTTTFGSDR